MKSLSSNTRSSLLALIVGLLLIIWPSSALQYLVIVIGLLFLIPGSVSVVAYFMQRNRQVAGVRFPIEAIGSLLFGVLLCSFPQFFINVLMYVWGGLLVIAGMGQMAYLRRVAQFQPTPWGYYVVPALVLLCGLVIIFSPGETAEFITILAGVSSLIYGVSGLFTQWRFRQINSPK